VPTPRPTEHTPAPTPTFKIFSTAKWQAKDEKNADGTPSTVREYRSEFVQYYDRTFLQESDASYCFNEEWVEEKDEWGSSLSKIQYCQGGGYVGDCENDLVKPMCGGFEGGKCVDGHCRCFPGFACQFCTYQYAALTDWAIKPKCPEWQEPYFPPQVGGFPCNSNWDCGSPNGGFCDTGTGEAMPQPDARALSSHNSTRGLANEYYYYYDTDTEDSDGKGGDSDVVVSAGTKGEPAGVCNCFSGYTCGNCLWSNLDVYSGRAVCVGKDFYIETMMSGSPRSASASLLVAAVATVAAIAATTVLARN
jgi:hypothetical protein